MHKMVIAVQIVREKLRKYQYFQITAFVVIPMTPNRGILCGCLIGGGFLFFFFISKFGQHLLEKIEAKIEAEETKSLKTVSTIPKPYHETYVSYSHM